MLLRSISDRLKSNEKELEKGKTEMATNGMKVTEVLVQNYGAEYDRDCLNRPSFLVNMRLFDVREEYRKLIHNVIEYMLYTLDINYSDYGNGTESGVAASTLGFPLSIIAYRTQGEKKVMINPQIVERSHTKIKGNSNCGCCRLTKKIEIFRHEWITVTFFDIKGRLKTEEKIDKVHGCLTIQHEIDHTIGFLPTDRYLQQGHNVSEVECLRPDFKNSKGS